MSLWLMPIVFGSSWHIMLLMARNYRHIWAINIKWIWIKMHVCRMSFKWMFLDKRSLLLLYTQYKYTYTKYVCTYILFYNRMTWSSFSKFDLMNVCKKKNIYVIYYSLFLLVRISNWRKIKTLLRSLKCTLMISITIILFYCNDVYNVYCLCN